jgi:hypothetical protein
MSTKTNARTLASIGRSMKKREIMLLSLDAQMKHGGEFIA